MAQGYALELVGVLDGSKIPAGLLDGRVQGGRLRAYVATFDFANAAVKHGNGDTNILFDLPAGEKPLFYGSEGSATMGGTATLAIGTAATPEKYRAAATHTNTTLTLAMLNTAIDDAPLAEPERVIMTWGAADGPSSGKLVIFFVTVGR